MRKIRKRFIILGFIIMGFMIALPLLYKAYDASLQYRHFFEAGDTVFTFWRTVNGCYITPYRYEGRTFPVDDYMLAAHGGGIIVYVGEDRTLYIFPNFTYEKGAGTIEINLSSFEYKYWPYPNGLEEISAFWNKVEYYKNLGYPSINVYIREMHAPIEQIKFFVWYTFRIGPYYGWDPRRDNIH
jgi:hypothetical protein